jgi:uncharacterized protein YaiE (UPF0345 family)
MFKTNEYFDGKVKSIAFETAATPATLGVMAAGSYEFGTATIEHMTVVAGEMKVILPGKTQAETFKAGQTFIVDKNTKFQVEVSEDTAYLCLYK